MLIPILSKPVICASASILAGAIPSTLVNINDPWYKSLLKPDWNPSPVVFPVVWTFLNALIGISACIGIQSSESLISFCINRIAAFSWTPLFFKYKSIKNASILLQFLILSTIHMMFVFSDSLSVYLLFPYLLWLCVACRLNMVIDDLNP